MNRSRTAVTAVTAVALTSVLGLSACARPGSRPTPVGFAAVDAASAAPKADPTGPPEPSVDQGQLADETPDTPSSPIPEPTVAKTQKWVKIFSGPSAKDITPPRSVLTGSKKVELNTAENAIIGTYVADGAGRTLYRFDEDSAKPPKATCNGDCAKAWPPLLIKSPGKIFPKGINPKIIGYVERADGHCQVTINGWPVYYFAKDAKPGDIRGQGVKGTWFAINPKGGKTGALPDSTDDKGNGGSAGDAGADEAPEDAPDEPGY